MIRAVILDDETKGSSLLEHKINVLDESIEVVQIYNNPQLALEEIKSLKADVVFLDVEMPKINGFQFLEQLGSFDFEVIFVTAYNEYALDALRANALDYLLKPVNPDELINAVHKLQKRISLKHSVRKDLSHPAIVSSRLALPTAEGIYFVKKKDILKVEAMSNYSIFYIISNPSKIIVSRTLKEYEALLTETNFIRVNRSCIINLDFVVRYKKGDGGMIEMVDESEIEVSSAKKSALIEKLFNY